MNNENNPSPQSAAQQQAQIVVNDPEDFAKTRQLRAIFDARDAYIETRREVCEELSEGNIDFPTANSRLLTYVQDFAMTLQPVLLRYDSGQEIWDDKRYELDGWARSKHVPSKETALQHAKENYTELFEQYQTEAVGPGLSSTKQGRLMDKIRWKATDTGVVITGVKSIVMSSPRLRFFSETGKIKKSNPPKQLSDDVFRDLQRVISDIGLGVDMQTEQQTKIDDDLLQEVDEWRRKNVS